MILNKSGNLRGITHGESRTRLFQAWNAMKKRCYCKSNTTYRNYGARGISVCQEWRDSYEAFRDWALANGYRDDLELDRRDNNGNYEPSNCRWATRRQQMANTRPRKGLSSQFKGVSWSKAVNKWRAQIRINGATAHLGVFASEEEAARTYDKAAYEAHRDFAHLNFPTERY